MSSHDKSFGGRMGGAVDKAKNTAQNAFSSTDGKRKEAGSRTDANAHDAQAENSGSLFDKAKHKIEGGVDRAEA